MGQQIIVQPNGKLAVWSSIVDHFVMTDADEDEILAQRVGEYVANQAPKIRTTVKALRAGRKTSPFGKTWEEAIETIGNVHGMGEQHDFLDKVKEGDGS